MNGPQCGDQVFDMACELPAGHDGNHQSISQHHVWTSTTPAMARAALAAWRQEADQPHHRAARSRTADEQAALEPEDAAAWARRHFGLPDGVDHAAALYPDDPERAEQHRAAIDRLRGSLAKHIERGREGRT